MGDKGCSITVRQQNMLTSVSPCINSSASSADDEVVQDSYLRVPHEKQMWEPICIYISIPALPRGAAVEVQPLVCSASKENEEANDSGSGCEETKLPRYVKQ